MHDAKNAQSALAQQIAQTIADEIGAQSAQVRAAVGLLDEGASVPFIARYRKEGPAAWTTPSCATWKCA
jgi:uncharacterized protein